MSERYPATLALYMALLSEMSVDLDAYLADGGQVHEKALCSGQSCVIHNPSDHHMKTWPRVMRSSTLIERTCVHGVGHPDPDSLAHFVRKDPDTVLGMHGCDGCCRVDLD